MANHTKQDFEKLGNENGFAKYHGRIFALTEKPHLSAPEFPDWQADVKDGEEYVFEWCADAIDENGDDHCIFWKFKGFKGRTIHAKNLDWSDVHDALQVFEWGPKRVSTQK